jgi:hypothetical protein
VNYIATFHNDEDNVTALVFKRGELGGHDCGFGVALRDDDAGQLVGSIRVFKTLDAAIAKAKEFAA